MACACELTPRLGQRPLGEVRTFAAANLASVVIVGDAKQFLEPLKKRFPNVEVIPAKELDLNVATLRGNKR